MTSIYKEILGSEFEKLGKNLQIAHGAFLVIAEGTIDVYWGKGWLVKMVNKANGLPPEGLNQPLSLEVIRKKEQETWNRKFTSAIFTTLQYHKKDLLVEKDGPVAIGFQLLVEGSSLVYKQKYMRFAGIPVPGFLSIKTKVMAIEQNEGWKAEVEIKAPIVGRLIMYHATVKLINYSL